MTTAITVEDLRLPDGTGLRCASVGAVRPADPAPLVLLHGFTDSWRSYEEILGLLPPGMTAVVPTFRGHGDSDRPVDGYGPADLAADVVAVLDRFGAERAVVVGHALGASVAGRVAVDHPTRVAGLVLLGAFATPSDNTGIAELVELVRHLEDPVGRDLVVEFQHSTVAFPVSDALMEAVVDEALKVPARIWRAAAEGFAGSDPLDGLDTVDVPVALIWGEHDAFVPIADQYLLMSCLTDARLLVYEETGHAVHWERPARFVADLVMFVSQLRR